MDGGAPLRVTLLGAFQVSRGDTALPVPGARLKALFVRLALAGGHAVDPTGLIDAIWAEDPPAGPAHALQALVSRLRRTLGSAGDVTQIADGYRLAVDSADVDALRFEELAAIGRQHLHAGHPRAAASALGGAVALWGESPGAEPTVVAAVAPAVATRLAHTSVEAVIDLADAELTLGQADMASARLSALLIEHPVHERAAALLMDALAAQGRQAEALARYEQVREALADGLGADPGAALRERHLRMLRADHPTTSERTAPADVTTPTDQPTQAAPPAARSTRSAPSNLPAPLTSFIGRDDDLARIGTLFATARLVTVLGPGGAGKTRLAVEAARRHRHAYRDGVWMIDLASVTEPAKVGAALLAATGLRGSALFEASARPPHGPGRELDVLTDQLEDRETLLVVDNCEHLIDAVAHLVAALLARCVGLRVLATSREPLAIDGETLVPLGPLPLPAPDADAGQARRAASTQLFVERAAAVRPGFDVDEHRLVDVLRIVRGLDGLPLALELAAARLRTFSLSDLAAGLSDRFRLLANGNRTALPRHRTLHAVIAWSWDLLGVDERTLAERIAVLSGGVTPASAAAVCAGTGVPAGEVRELLAGLVDRSLLQLAPDSGRYRMLETVRAYGLERLAEYGDLARVRDLAARYFAALVARHEPLLRGPGQLDTLHLLSAEYDNVLAALRHFHDSGDADAATRLAVDLIWCWHMLGRDVDAAHWLGETVALPTERPSVERDIAEGILRLGVIDIPSRQADDTLKERRTAVRGLTERLRGRPELPGFGGALIAIRLASLEGNGASSPSFQQLADGPDVWLAGLALMLQAHFAENEGHLDQARHHMVAALDRFERTGDRWGLAKVLPLRALLRQYDGDLDGALADLDEATRLARSFGTLNPSDEIFIDLRRIEVHARLDETARAAELIAVSRERALGSTSPEMAVLLDAREAHLRVRVGDTDGARALVESAERGVSEQLRSSAGEHGRALVATARGALCIELGDAPGAEEALGRAYAAAVASGDLPFLATVAVTVAGLAALHGRHRDSAAVLGAAARLRGAHDRTDPHVRTLTARGLAALGEERFTEAYESGWRLDATEALHRTDPARLFRVALPGPDGPQARRQ
ncbi:AfsR/SARP family transcriptional regulator [Streptomyces luteocolor]|uniref:AfsR/SARP family transcriptional regulator n=1 Tax=Streptomyces luteocolor TaxID=285500 RepID=UPI000853D390|nr:BTAD domain-containing putative transcriptional regulator [Streptomyces luteocolor]